MLLAVSTPKPACIKRVCACNRFTYFHSGVAGSLQHTALLSEKKHSLLSLLLTLITMNLILLRSKVPPLGGVVDPGHVHHNRLGSISGVSGSPEQARGGQLWGGPGSPEQAGLGSPEQAWVNFRGSGSPV